MGSAAAREAIGLWAIAFAAIAITRAIGPISGYAKAVAAVGFLYLPGLVVWRRNEDYRDYGATLRQWKSDFRFGLLVSLIILPIFVAGFFGFLELLKAVPREWVPFLAPYRSSAAGFHFRLPDRFPAYVLDQFLVVALPEELFYRGYMQSRLRDAWPGGRRIAGMQLGKAFWWTQILFALGHLAEPHPWRLAVFFPAIVFGLMREKSGTIVPSTIFHALSNLTVMVLEASFFGPR
jgi:membrane protease YdiL (CAAX protease family)